MIDSQISKKITEITSTTYVRIIHRWYVINNHRVKFHDIIKLDEHFEIIGTRYYSM